MQLNVIVNFETFLKHKEWTHGHRKRAFFVLVGISFILTFNLSSPEMFNCIDDRFSVLIKCLLINEWARQSPRFRQALTSFELLKV